MNFSFTVLGSSSAIPTSKSYTSAHVVKHHGHFFLVDCGEGTQMRLRELSIPFSRINHIFISHLHGDHFFGLFGLLTTFNLLNRKQVLHIYSFPDIKKVLNTDNPELIFGENFGYKIIFHDLNSSSPETIYESKNLSIRSVPMKHRIPCCGFVFTEKPLPRKLIKEKIDYYQIPVFKRAGIKNGEDLILDNGKVILNKDLTSDPQSSRKIAVCSDTLYNKALIAEIKNADLLYYEATFMHKLLGRARETCHSTARQAGQIAKESGAKKLIIGHFSVRYKDISELEVEARKVFAETYAATDKTEFEL